MWSLPRESYESEDITQVDNPMEKTCAAEENRTTDTMGVEKKRGKKGEVLRTERRPMMC